MIVFMTASSVMAQAAIPGKNFREASRTGASTGKPEVLYFFLYRCPHCMRAAEEVDAWQQQQRSVATVRSVPLIFSELDQRHAAMYYTLQSLGKLDALHAGVFRAVQLEKKSLATVEDQAAYFEPLGIPRGDYLSAAQSPAVASNVARAQRDTRNLSISAAPSIAIANRYITDPELAGSVSQALQVASDVLNRVVSGQSGSLAAGSANTPAQTTTSPPATKPPAAGAGGATTGTVVSTGQGGSRPVGVEAGNLYFVQAEYPGAVGLNKDMAPMMFAAIDSQTALSAVRQFHLKRYPSVTPPLLTVRGECTGTSSWGAVVDYVERGSAATNWAHKHRWGGGCGATPAAAILSAEQACISRGGSCNANRQANALVYVDLAHSGAAPWLAAWASEPSAYMSWGAIGATTRMHDNASYVDSPADAIAKLGKVCAGNYGPRPCFFVSTQWRECLMKYDRSDQAGRCTETRLTPQGFTGAVRH